MPDERSTTELPGRGGIRFTPLSYYIAFQLDMIMRVLLIDMKRVFITGKLTVMTEYKNIRLQSNGRIWNNLK